jgi:hypothetical protein
MIALMEDRKGISTQLQAGLNAAPALVPATPWLDRVAPPAPLLKKQRDNKVLIQPAKGEAAARFAVWQRHGATWSFTVQPAGDLVVAVGDADAVVVSAVDRLGNESGRTALTLRRPKKS